MLNNPVVEAAEAAVKQLSAADLSDPMNLRALQKAMQGLLQVKQAFAAGPAEEATEMFGVDAEYGSMYSGLGSVYPPLGVPLRQQRPNAPETFASRMIREVMAVIPQFMEQGRQTALARRARAISELAFEIRESKKHGDEETAALLKTTLADLVEAAKEPVSETESLAGAAENLKDTNNGPTQFAVSGLAGLTNMAIQSGGF